MTRGNESPIVIYEDSDKAVEVRLDTDRDTVWLTQRQMAELFDTSSDNVSLHLKNIYGDEELEESVTTEDSSVVRQEGKRQVARSIKHYNLDAIISLGYRVNSRRAVQFRQWATRKRQFFQLRIEVGQKMRRGREEGTALILGWFEGNAHRGKARIIVRPLTIHCRYR